MHELSDHERALAADTLDDRPPAVFLCWIGQPGLKQIPLGKGLIGIEALRNDQTESAIGERRIVVRHSLRRHALRSGADPRHRGYGEPIAKGEPSKLHR